MIDFSVSGQREDQLGARIKVVGVGGGGGNAVNSMVESDLEGVDFVVANTDAQSLQISPVEDRIQLGEKVTKGLGAGSNPDIGRRAAEEDIEAITKHIQDADILFLTAGMGGGTGTGATPVIARTARELGILTVAVVTKPFVFEGRKRLKQAQSAIELLKKEVDTLLVVPNQKLLEFVDPNISMLDAFALVNDVLKQAIKGVSDIIIKPGHINVDFADVRTIMKGMGMALMGTGCASGEGRAQEAARNAISSPLLENMSIDGARGVLINITGSSTLGLGEINKAAAVIYDKAREDADIILGSVIDESMGDEVLVTVIATGFEHADDQGETTYKPSSITTEQEQQPVAYAQTPEQHSRVYQEVQQQEPVASVEHALNEIASDESDVKPAVAASLDINDLDTPTVLRDKVEKHKEDAT